MVAHVRDETRSAHEACNHEAQRDAEAKLRLMQAEVERPHEEALTARILQSEAEHSQMVEMLRGDFAVMDAAKSDLLARLADLDGVHRAMGAEVVKYSQAELAGVGAGVGPPSPSPCLEHLHPCSVIARVDDARAHVATQVPSHSETTEGGRCQQGCPRHVLGGSALKRVNFCRARMQHDPSDRREPARCEHRAPPARASHGLQSEAAEAKKTWLRRQRRRLSTRDARRTRGSTAVAGEARRHRRDGQAVRQDDVVIATLRPRARAPARAEGCPWPVGCAPRRWNSWTSATRASS